MQKNKYLIPILIYTSWSGLGFIRGINYYKYTCANKNKPFIYSNSIIEGLIGVFFYANPILFPVTIHKELYKLETTNCKIFKDSLKTNPSIYNETKKKLCNFFKKKRDLQKQIILEKNKLLNKDYSYVCLFKTIDV
jgi:hypothetical protein